jgi:diguanylate cyclase (GGDEF)-like protein
MADWEELFAAVTARLRRLGAQPPPEDGWIDSARTAVLECAEALDQLHFTLAHEQRLSRLHGPGLPPAWGRSQPGGAAEDLGTLPDPGPFRDRLDRALAPVEHARPALAVMTMGLDEETLPADGRGPVSGEEVLRIVAQRLKRAMRAGDIVCRIGSHEFACVLTDLVTREQLSLIACKLFDLVSAPLKIGPVRLTVRPNIGIAVCPADGATAAALLQHADAAMSHARQRQTGYAFFDPRARPS